MRIFKKPKRKELISQMEMMERQINLLLKANRSMMEEVKKAKHEVELKETKRQKIAGQKGSVTKKYKKAQKALNDAIELINGFTHDPEDMSEHDKEIMEILKGA